MAKGVKKERAAAERERQKRKEELARAQQARLDEEQARIDRKWRSLWKHRLDSDEAYTNFEVFFRQRVNTVRYLRSHNPELSLTIYRYCDGKPIDLEVILTALEQERIIAPYLLLIAKQLAIKELWSGSQLGRLQDILIKHLSFHRWHKSVRPIARLARVITSDDFEARVRLLLAYGGAREEMATRLLAQLEQERKMRVGRPRKR